MNLLFKVMHRLFQDVNLLFQVGNLKTEIKSFWPYCSSVYKNAVRHWPFTAATISLS